MLFPIPRTYPTVKPLAIMNKRNLRSWEVRLGPGLTVFLVGLITGCMVCAFLLGFSAGHRTGIEVALDNTVSSMVKLPIGVEDEGEGFGEAKPVEISADIKNEALALNLAPYGSEAQGGVGENEAPTNVIKQGATVEKAPIQRDSETLSAGAVFGGTGESHKQIVPAKEEPIIKVLGEEKPDDKSQTLAMLATKKEEKIVLPAKENKAIKEEKKEPVKVEEKKAEPAKAVVNEKSAYMRDRIPTGWFAQVAAPTLLQDADDLARQLKQAGFGVVIENAKVRGQSYFRVLVGPESKREQAEILIRQLKREKYLKGEPFIRMVK